jgi:hypothetical protein
MIFRFAFALILLSGFSSSSFGDPVQWSTTAGGNGHSYDFVYSPNITWTSEDAAAMADTWHGVNGYLATITSAAENNFLFSTFPAQAGGTQEGWLGGYQNTASPSYSEPDGGWQWVTGEPWNYTSWATNEPDNDGSQNYLRGGSAWDDFQNDPSNPSVQYVSGYFVEYAVPEPSSITIVAVAASLFANARKRKSGTPGIKAR